MSSVTSDTTANGSDADEWTVDELARRADLPVRTIREYQTIGVLPPPTRRGRIGLYRPAHLIRLELIGRLQQRGYSLAGIRDLLGAWRDGADLGEVLGLAPDQLVHLDEPGVPATLDQLAALLPALVPNRLDDLVATGMIEACGPDRYCVPSPSLLQLSIDALAAGVEPDALLELLGRLRAAADTASAAVLEVLARLSGDTDDPTIDTLFARGRGLLGHGVGRLTLHRLGRSVGAPDHATNAELAELLRNRTRPSRKPKARR
ncbi:MAG: MerR family transcriptional regulator [Acidimicrobiales bacterium]